MLYICWPFLIMWNLFKHYTNCHNSGSGDWSKITWEKLYKTGPVKQNRLLQASPGPQNWTCGDCYSFLSTGQCMCLDLISPDHRCWPIEFSGWAAMCIGKYIVGCSTDISDMSYVQVMVYKDSSLPVLFLCALKFQQLSSSLLHLITDVGHRLCTAESLAAEHQLLSFVPMLSLRGNFPLILWRFSNLSRMK